MTMTVPKTSARPAKQGGDWLRDAIPKLVLSPSLFIILVFVYGFIFFTFYLSFTDSRILPSYDLVGWLNYERLFKIRAWDIAVVNLLIFGSLYIVICCVLGLLLACAAVFLGALGSSAKQLRSYTNENKNCLKNGGKKNRP